MSANLNTEIEMEGKLEEIKSALGVIKDFCTYKHDAKIDSPTISLKKKFTDKNSFSLEQSTNKSLDNFLKDFKRKIFVKAGGPYGSYGCVDEAGLFQAISEAIPNAKFKGETFGFTTGQRDYFRAELKNGKLYLTYKYLSDYSESEDDWLSEESVYDPIKKEYERA